VHAYALERIVATDIVSYQDPPIGVSFVVADLNDPLPFDDGTFDLIVAVEVVEHLENIRAVCREFARLLRPGGKVVLTTPNNESMRAIGSLFLRGHFVAFGASSYPAHITALVRTDIERAMLEAGMRVERFFYSEEGSIPRLPRLTWQEVSFGILTGRRFSDNMGCVASKV
jgi:2-polyprenyl-3-methyl-5-hydroxy-6-metoxy-1,4-benzoquinol methylase